MTAEEPVETPNATTTDREPAVEVEDVSVAFGAESVLEGVTASVDPGELVGLVGPNGAGKTTLLRSISGALVPDAGTVRVGGDDVGALSSAAASRRMAVVPQTTTLSFAFSVRELVAMGRHPHRSRFEPPTREDRRLVEDAMERTRTAAFAERSIEDVSGGERQRVLLARAIAQDAPVLLLDEPTANLDLHHAVETMSLVREVVDADGAAAIAAIHDLELAARVCDRIVVLAGGGIVASGPPRAVLDADRLEAAFDARIAVEPAPVGGGLAIRALDDAEIDARVHVVGSGEPAAAAIGRLGEAGAELSLGPVPEGDRAVSTAAAFDAEVATAPPFSGVDAATRERALKLTGAADATVLAADDVGPDAAVWLECCDAADGVIVLDGTTLAPELRDGREDGASRLGRAPTAALDSLPGAVAAVRARDAAADREPPGIDELADPTLADGGVESGTDDS